MIKFLDLKKINSVFEPELTNAIKRVLDSGLYIQGNEVKAFENEYAQFIGSRYCISVANGLDALRLILRTYIEMGIMHEGDEIIVSANTYIASILAITENRLVPILVEPDINTYNINPFVIEERINKRTRGVMIVHLYGRNAIHPEIERLVSKYNLKLIEDNAQATGANNNITLNNKSVNCSCLQQRTGSIGHAAGHSFYPGKNLGALGDGGAITTNDEEFARIVRIIANYGSFKKYENHYKGLNSRLDEIQAAVLRIKLPYLEIHNQKRRRIAEFYCNNIKNHRVILPNLSNKDSHVWHLFVIRCAKRNEMQKYLTNNNIQTLIHYPIPPHKQEAFKEWNTLKLPITELIHNEVLSLPISPIMDYTEINKVIEIINNFNF